MEREKALEVALLQIEKQFGKGSVMRMGVDGPADPVQAISTGSLALALALGIGGVPRGRVVEIYGPGLGQDHPRPAHHRRGPEGRRHRRLRRRRARLDVTYARNLGVNDELLISSRTPASRPSRSPTCWSLGRHRRHRDRLRGRPGPRAEIEARWATPTSASRPTS